ncbi:MAG: S1C family serine protease [Myxococcaceae bacterium]
MNATSSVPSAAVSLSESLADVTASVGRSLVGLAGRRWPASGVAYAADLVLTAAHAVNRLERLAVLVDGVETPAELVGQDAALDLALLRVSGAKLEPARWRPSAGLRPGSLVLAVARPRGSVRARLGLLAAVGAPYRTPWGARVDAALDVELSARPGLAGAVVADVEGLCLGLLVSGLGRSRRMLLPTETLARTAEELVSQGRVRRGYLGVGTQPVRLPAALRGVAGREHGLLVVAVEAGSPADAAGLTFGDVLLQVGTTSTADVHDLLGTLAEARIGEPLPLQVLRAGAVQERSVTVGVRP